MAEFHNFSDLKVRHLLESELLDIRNELRKAHGYDPTMSLAENVELFVFAAQELVRLYKKLRIQHEELKKERENDKNVARSYPFAGDCVIGGTPASQSTRTVAWFDGSGCSIADPFADYHPSRESVSSRLLGSTDGYGR